MGAVGSGAYYAVIPAEVRYDRELKPNAKLLYGEITSLCNSTGYCWATNEYFAELFDLSVPTITRLISQLAERGYIRTEMAKNEKGSERRIYAGVFVSKGGLIKNDDTPRGGLIKNDERGLIKNDDPQHLRIINNNIPPISPTGDSPAESTKKTVQIDQEIWFEAFWKKYPRKDGKQQARRAWARIKPDFETCRIMAAALARDKQSRQWTKDNGEYIPLPATWLNQRRWENEGIDHSQIQVASGAPPDGLVVDPEVM